MTSVVTMVMTLTTLIVGILAVMIKVREALMIACKKQAFFMGIGFIRLVVLTPFWFVIRPSPTTWVALLYSSQAFSVPQPKMAAGISAHAH